MERKINIGLRLLTLVVLALGIISTTTAATLKLPAFSAIYVGNGFNVQIVGGRSDQMSIKGSRGLVKSMAHVSGRTLFITQPTKASDHRTKVTVHVQNLRNLHVAGTSRVTGRNINSRGLTITSSGSANITLRGFINLRTIIHDGSGRINVRWVNSDNLMVLSSGSGKIYLAGIANTLHAQLSGRTLLDAKYLRVRDKAWVETEQRAVAQVTPIHSLNAFASDNSYVYYFKTPKFSDNYSNLSGNVLQMRHWD